MNFKKYLEYSDMGGEVSYNHMNNTVSGDDFNQLPSKYMAGTVKKDYYKPNINRLFGKKRKIDKNNIKRINNS